MTKKTITELIIKKYRYTNNIQPSPNPNIVNRRIRKAVEEAMSYYNLRNDDAKDYSKVLSQKEDTIKFMFEFIQKNNLEDKWKKECIKELII